jgi:hypothetical protein
MKSLKDYLAESQQLHEYVIRFAQKPSDVDMDALEQVLKKFDLRDVSSPEKIQNSDLDFFDIPYRDIYQVRVATGVKLSPYVLLQDLRTALNINEKEIRVRGAHDPVQNQHEHQEWYNEIRADAKSKGWRPQSRLSTDRDYHKSEHSEAPVAYGNDYNKNLLGYLNSVAQDRKSHHTDAPNPLFSWLDMDKAVKPEPQGDDFNAGYNTPGPRQPADISLATAPWLLATNVWGNHAQPRATTWQDSKNKSHVEVHKQKGKTK